MDQAVSLLGLPSESDFILKGPYNQDLALIRNSLGFELSRRIGHYSPRTRFIELFANFDGNAVSQSDYMGVYMLTESIKADSNRVDIERLSTQQNSQPELSGGYMFKSKDTIPGSGDFTTIQGRTWVLFEPDQSRQTTTQKNFLSHYVDQFESALFGPNFTDPQSGYPAFIDV